MLRVLGATRWCHLRHPRLTRTALPAAVAPLLDSSALAPTISRRSLTTGGSDDKDKKKPPNYDRRILQPAQQGKLASKQGSGIPKLAARKSKAHLTPVAGRGGHRGPPPSDLDYLLSEEEEDGRNAPYRMQGESGEKGQTDFERTMKYITEDYDPYFAFELMDDNKYYWREEEFEDLLDDRDDSFLYGPDGKDTLELEYTKEDMAPRGLLDESMAASIEQYVQELTNKNTPMPLEQLQDESAGDTGEREYLPRRGEMDPEQWFFRGSVDILEAPNRQVTEADLEEDPPEISNEMVELAPQEPGVSGFIQAMQEHPTDIARISYYRQTPANQREPIPDFPKNRQPHPPIEYVESHNRFIYVTGLPPLVVNGEQGDLENPVHRSFLEKLVAQLANVDSSQVWPVNTTSAFVGFPSPRAMADALKEGPSEKVLSYTPHINLLSAVPEADNPFADTEADRVVQLTYIPPGHTPSSLLRILLPPDSELETMYGKSVDASKDVYFLSSTKVLLRFASVDEAKSFVSSSFLPPRLEDFGMYRVRYFRARRELVHSGFTGPANDDELRVMGPRLFVDGDMPSKDFFQSHPRCIHVRQLDPLEQNVELLTDLFQPFSELPRQAGSIELVTCEAGFPTDRAYIGFDLPGEAEACMRQCKGMIRVGDRKLLLRLVNDRGIPGTPLYRAEKRPARPVEELWDDLNNWEKYVDPADIEYLDQHGVSKLVIDEALRKIRRFNPSFGPLDRGLRSEALEPETAPGDLFKEVVVYYVQTLKECVATPENPGYAYEALFMPDEPIDLSIFDKWEKRKAEIEAIRSRP
jgi:hypothetical protein